MNIVVDYVSKKVIVLMVGLSFSFLIAVDAEEKAKKEAEEKDRLAAEEKQKEMEAQSQTEQGKAEKKTSGEAKGQVNGARTNKAKNPKGDKAGEKQQNGEKGLPGKGSLEGGNDVTSRTWWHPPFAGSSHGSMFLHGCNQDPIQWPPV